MDKIFITDLVARGIIGVNDWERETPQEILINVILSVDTRKAGVTDNVHDTVSYSDVADKLLAHAESVKRLTVEALAQDLAALCLEQPGVERIQIRVEKPGAVRFARSVGVEIERVRSQTGQNREA